MDREYLEDYEQKEKTLYEKLVEKRLREGKFSFEKDRYPPDERFVKLQKPIALATTVETVRSGSFWAQIPFSGSLILKLPPFVQSVFEKTFFKVSEISKIIDFIKETGRLQIAFTANLRNYVGLDYLDPFFQELNAPYYPKLSLDLFWNKKEIERAVHTFYTLAHVRYLEFLQQWTEQHALIPLPVILAHNVGTYASLKLGHYIVVEEIENLMIDDPRKALILLHICSDFIDVPFREMRSDIRNYALEDIRAVQGLPLVYQPQEIRFPCEIGKFLLEELTYAPKGLRACYDLIDHYDTYDLQKVQESLNEAIVTNDYDIVSKSTEELSEILENVWNDPSIPRRIKNLRRGIPMSIAAIGTAVSAFTGGLEGFLTGLGFSVGAKFLDVEIEGLAERLVKFFARSYQANVYDFKKKYKITK